MDKTLEERLLHVKYEYAMAKFCITELEREKRQAWWNALFVAFVVYWRNGKHFLNSDDGPNSIKANRYIKRFVASSLGHLTRELNAIGAEVTHLGLKRCTEDEKKFGLEGARKCMGWLVENFKNFEADLGEPYKSIWFRQEEAAEIQGMLLATTSIQAVTHTCAIGDIQIVQPYQTSKPKP